MVYRGLACYGLRNGHAEKAENGGTMNEETNRFGQKKAEITWYPGHMAKAKRELAAQLSRVDVIIELCDARLPLSSRNPDLLKLGKNKPRVVLLGKADLADPNETKKWIERFRSEGAVDCMALDTRVKAGSVLPLIRRAAEAAVGKAADRGIRKTVRCMVIGVPNVGKSTLINRLHGTPVARVGDMPGVTRSTQWVRISPYLELMDSPGLLWPRLDDRLAARRLCYIAAIRDDIADMAELTIQLLRDMIEAAPKAVEERFRIRDLSLTGAELLDAVCRGRGFLMKGGVYDYDRACTVVLDEYRGGKLGRITLERCPAAVKAAQPDPDQTPEAEEQPVKIRRAENDEQAP